MLTEHIRLKDAGLLLEPADVFHDLIDITRRDTRDFRHVAELPMMRLDTVGGGPLERGIAVMIRLINLVDERRPLFGPHATHSVTRRTIGRKLLLPALQVRRYGHRLALRLRLALTTRRSGPQRKPKHTHPHRL